MSLDHILLGLLHKPASGYDLKRAFEESIRHFWSAKLSQIYPTLDRLERAAHVRSKKVASAKGPDRRVFRRTAAGRRELLKWLRSGPQLGAERFAYVAQLAFMHELQDLKHTREFVEQLKVRLTELHRFFTAMGRPSPTRWPTSASPASARCARARSSSSSSRPPIARRRRPRSSACAGSSWPIR